MSLDAKQTEGRTVTTVDELVNLAGLAPYFN